MKNDLISVIIPVYNTEKYLKKCVNSFINQTYENVEIILVDDGSTDSSSIICDEYSRLDTRIRVIHKKNGGLSDARNVGIEKSSGDLITFFDSDDYVEHDYIEYLYKLKLKYKTQISLCSYNVVNEAGKLLSQVLNISEECITKEDFFMRMLNENGITVSACFKLYEKCLFNNIRFPYGKLCEDNGTTYKIIENTSHCIAIGNKAKGYYVIRNNSIMRSSFNLRKLDMITLTDEMCDYLSINYPAIEDYIERRRIYARFNVLRQINHRDKSTRSLENELVDYILKQKSFILKNKIVPKRDKIACLLLLLSRKLFFISWELYRKFKYE